MKNLKKLYANDNCGIDQKGIEGLDLIELNVNGNIKIRDISFMKNLKKLSAKYECGINQKGIEGLDLIELNSLIRQVSRNFRVYAEVNLLLDALRQRMTQCEELLQPGAPYDQLASVAYDQMLLFKADEILGYSRT